MIAYADGTEIRTGDSVLIERGKTAAVVTLIVESAEDQKECNVKEAGVMFESPTFGLVFIPVSTLSADPAVFVGRGKPTKLKLS